MQDFLFFLGRFHVLALHLPIGIMIAAVVLDWLGRRPRFAALAQTSAFLWGAAALSAIVTVVLGLLHFAEGGFTGPSALAHRLFGILTAFACAATWWLAARAAGAPARRPRLTAGVLTFLLVSITGHYGGNLTHGSTYLIEYAPPFLRSLLGAQERRSAVTSVAAADPYLDIVKPLLEQRCGSCHNEDKRNGGFSVATYELTLVGGDTGSAVVPGNLEASELLYRVNLPVDDEAHMPAEGKTPLTPAQIEILGWWISAGAPHDTTVGAVGAGAALLPLLAAQLGLDGATAPSESARPAVSPDAALVERLFAAGFLVRQVSQEDARLVVSVNSPGSALDAAALAALATAAPNIVDLNLANAALHDADLAALGNLPEVTHLRLAHNELTDASAAALAALPRLTYLNLYGNAGVTDAGLEALAHSASLREIYVWETGVSAPAATRVQSSRPDLTVNLGTTGASP